MVQQQQQQQPLTRVYPKAGPEHSKSVCVCVYGCAMWVIVANSFFFILHHSLSFSFLSIFQYLLFSHTTHGLPCPYSLYLLNAFTQKGIALYSP